MAGITSDDIWDVGEVFEGNTIEITNPKFTITCNMEFEDAYKKQFIEVARMREVLKELRKEVDIFSVYGLKWDKIEKAFNELMEGV